MGKAKAPRPGSPGTTGAREKANLRSRTIGVTVGEDSYRVPVANLPLAVVGEFTATFGVAPAALVFGQDGLARLKALWWLGRRCAGERVNPGRFEDECVAMFDTADDTPGFFAVDFSDFDDDDEDAAEDDSPEV